MAKNWTMAEVAEEIKNGTSKENIIDIGKRFPMVISSVSAALAGDKKSIYELLTMLPEYVTAGKIEKAARTGAEDATDGDDSDGEATETEATETPKASEKPTVKPATKPAATTATASSDDLEKKTGKEVWDMCKELGYTSGELKGKKKADLIEMYNAKAGSAKPATSAKPTVKATEATGEKTPKELYTMCKEKGIEAEQKKPAQYYLDKLAEAEAAEAESNEVDYSKMSAKELYKLCKDNGIEVEQKKPSTYYIEKLEANSAEAPADDWGDGEETPVEEKKSTKPTKDKPAVKADEWEI